MTDEKKGGKEQGDGAHGYGFVASLEIPSNESYVSMSCPATTSPHQKEINTFPSKHNSAATWGRRITVDGCMVSITAAGEPSQRWRGETKWSWREGLEKKTPEKMASAGGKQDEEKRRGRESTRRQWSKSSNWAKRAFCSIPCGHCHTSPLAARLYFLTDEHLLCARSSARCSHRLFCCYRHCWYWENNKSRR